ncbi:MAG TPA: hypothetical protein VHL80_19560 [Polyangia bacterium]|nr:hypothetical protein [Polyangia bacterium]
MDRATEAHRSAVICALLGVVGTALGVVGFWSYSGTPLRVVQAVGILVSATALVILRARRPPYSRALSNAIFLLDLVPTIVMVWLVDDARAAHSARWVPYEPNKLSALTIAMIAPPGWATGVAGILGFVGSAVVHQLAFVDVVRAREAAGEPFGVVAYGVFALLLLGFRQRGHAMREELARARSEKLALERVARVAITLRDLANSPVQTLELVRQELIVDAPQLRVHEQRMKRALEQLRKLNEVLMRYQDAVPWDARGHAFEDELFAPWRATAAGGRGGAAPTRAPPAPLRRG